MQIESYEPQELATKGDRIQVPGVHAGALAPVQPPPPAPRLFAVLGSEIRKRKGLLGVWLVLTAAVAGAVVFQFAKPQYRAEAKFKYSPNWRGGQNAPYTPPNIQTATQMLRSSAVLDPVREAHVPAMSKDEFGKAVRVEIVKQSEFVDVSFDHPDPAVAAAVANDLQARGVVHFDTVRKKALEDAAAKVRADYQYAGEALERAKQRLQAASLAKGVADLPAEKKEVERAIEDIETQLRNANELQARLQKQIKHQEELRDAPASPNERTFDSDRLSLLQSSMTRLQAELQNQTALDDAKANLAQSQKLEQEYRPLVARGVVTQAEYDKVVLDIDRYKRVIRTWEDKRVDLETARKQHDALVKQAGTGKIVRREVIAELEKLNRELSSVPTTIQALKQQLNEKRARSKELLALERELGPKLAEEDVYQRQFTAFGEKMTDTELQSKDVNANDLWVESAADVPTIPYSSNAPKLALGIAGASGLLFLGYIGLFALPQLSAPGPASEAVVPAQDRRPPALIALFPFMRESNGQAGQNGTLADSPPKPADLPRAPEPEVRPEPAVVEPAKRVEEIVPEPEPVVVAEPKAEALPEPAVEPQPVSVPAAGPELKVYDAGEPKVEPQPVAAPAEQEQVEDFGAPVPVTPVVRPEPRIPVAPVPLESAVVPVAVKEPPAPVVVVEEPAPAPRVVSLSALLKPILSLPPDQAPTPEPRPSEPRTVVVPAAKSGGPVRALAERIVEENVDRGGIVLFAPTIEQLRVTPVIGDLGKILTGRGDRVLVFDARPAAESPAWAGPRVPTVTGFLAGQSAAGIDACFAPTVMKGVEYSRGDLSGKLDGVMAAHRFRQLVEEMQERYSLVLMVAPPVTLDGSEPVFSNLAEGMVLVTESTAPSAAVHAFIESLTKRVAAPLYGTLTVPRA